MQIWNKITKISDASDDIPEGWTDKSPAWIMFEKWSEQKNDWIVDESEKFQFEKETALKIVSARSKSERSAILDDQTISNIGFGATNDYPSYLQGETGKTNVNILIEQFKTIAKTAKANIKAATTKAEVDAVLSNLKFPIEAEILAAINK